MGARYVYEVRDLMTDVLLDELPLSGTSFSRMLNVPGQFRGAINLDGEFKSNDDILRGTTPGRTSLYAYRYDDFGFRKIVWGGIVWSRWYQSQAKVLQIYGETFESYPHKRKFRHAAPARYVNVAQCAIIQDLWEKMQSVAGGHIGVNYAALPTSDVTRTLTAAWWDGKAYGDYIDELLNNHTDACDYIVDVYESGGRPVKELRTGYPQLGNSVENSGLLLTYPGNILNYYWTENASAGNAVWLAFGDGDGSGRRLGTAVDIALLESGYPLTEGAERYETSAPATLNTYAAAKLLQLPVPVITQQFDLKADAFPEFGTYGLGDYGQAQIVDARFPSGIQIGIRAIGWNVTPSSADSTEEVSLILQQEEDSSG